MRIRYILGNSEMGHEGQTPSMDEKVAVVRKLLESNLKGDACKRRLLESVVLAFRVNFQDMTADKDILAGMKKEIKKIFDKEWSSRNIDAADIGCKKALSNNLYIKLAENIEHDVKNKKINAQEYKSYFREMIQRTMDEIITQHTAQNPLDEIVIGIN